MRYLLFAILLTVQSYAFTSSQIKLFNLAKSLAKPYDLENTLCGIIWVESQAGKYKINPSTEDYGVSQINIYSLLRRLNVEATHLNKSFYATQLVVDDEYALKAALLELLYWQLDRNRTSWWYLVSSYNQGNTISDYTYAAKVANAIRYLKSKGILDEN